jgi:hypothetical protein
VATVRRDLSARRPPVGLSPSPEAVSVRRNVRGLSPVSVRRDLSARRPPVRLSAPI